MANGHLLGVQLQRLADLDNNINLLSQPPFYFHCQHYAWCSKLSKLPSPTSKHPCPWKKSSPAIYCYIRDFFYNASNILPVTGVCKNLRRFNEFANVQSLKVGYSCVGNWRQGNGFLWKVHRHVSASFWPLATKDVGELLLTLRQGPRKVSEFGLKCCTVVAKKYIDWHHS